MDSFFLVFAGGFFSAFIAFLVVYINNLKRKHRITTAQVLMCTSFFLFAVFLILFFIFKTNNAEIKKETVERVLENEADLNNNVSVVLDINQEYSKYQLISKANTCIITLDYKNLLEYLEVLESYGYKEAALYNNLAVLYSNPEIYTINDNDRYRKITQNYMTAYDKGSKVALINWIIYHFNNETENSELCMNYMNDAYESGSDERIDDIAREIIQYFNIPCETKNYGDCFFKELTSSQKFSLIKAVVGNTESLRINEPKWYNRIPEDETETPIIHFQEKEELELLPEAKEE